MKDNNQTPENYNEFEYYFKNAEYLREFHAFRHDFRNHLAALKMLLDSNQLQKASEYLSSLEHMFHKSTGNIKKYSDNALIDAILQDVAHKCEINNIAFDAEVVTGQELPLSDIDICTVFTNLCNNAYEAQQDKDFPEKFISLSSSLREKWYIITVENRFNGQTSVDDNEIETTKENKVYHGHGLNNIKKVINSVEGAKILIEPNFEQKIFRVSVVFPRKSD